MPADDTAAALTAQPAQPAQPTLRERRRAAATREILDAAERRLAEHGPAALSLRAVARSLGMTVQALYHYFPSRNDLVTALIAKAYVDLADAVQAAVDAAAHAKTGDDEARDGDEDEALPGLVVAAEAYRHWALAHPEHFQLLYGTPLRDYAAPPEGPTTQAVRRMGAIFEREMFAGFTPEQLAAADTVPLSPSLRSFLEGLPPTGELDLPPTATALFLRAWGHMHGLVVLEVFGHTGFLGGHQAEIFRSSMRDLARDVRHRFGHSPGNRPETET